MSFCRRVCAAAVIGLLLAGGAAGLDATRAAAPEGPPAQAPPPPVRVYLPLLAPQPSAVLPVEASVPRGFYEAPLTVALSTQTPGTTVRYTLDGRVPTEAHGATYQAPLRITGTTTLRARAFGPRRRPSPVTTHSYVFLRDVIEQRGQPDPARFPPTWGVYPPDSVPAVAGHPVPAEYGLDPRVVERYRETIVDDLSSLPSVSLVMDPDDLFDPGRGIYANPLAEGRAWERPVSVEILVPDAAAGHQLDAGLRIAGRWSRKPDSMAKHSLSLRFRGEYGPTKLRYPLFPGSPVTRFDTVRLRGSQADSFPFFAHKGQYLHDQWGRDTQRAMGWLSAHGTYVHLYLNGQYWGLYNAAEEPTASFVAQHEGGDKDEIDVIKEGHAIEDGRFDAYARLLEIRDAHPQPDRTAFEQMAALLDIEQHIDYTLLQIYVANQDWAPDRNWRAARQRRPGARFQFFAWDIEHGTALHDADARCGTPGRTDLTDCGDIADTEGVDGLHGWLERVPEYRRMFADRVGAHLFGDGALTPGPAAARYRRLATGVERAIVGESARWGRALPQPRTRNENIDAWLVYWDLFGEAQPGPQTLDDHWRPERDRLLTEFFPQRTDIVLAQLCREGLYPPVAAPRMSHHGGAVPAGFALELSLETRGCQGMARDGTIYYTLDGTDPRHPWSRVSGSPWSGVVAPTARRYRPGQPIGIYGYTRVRARTLSVVDGDFAWSALTEATFGDPRLAVTEIMYDPRGGSDYEYLELHNRESVAVDVSRVRLGGGITRTLPSDTVIPPGGYLVVAKDPEAFRSRYPDVPLAAEFDGRLANDGEEIRLYAPDGRLLLDVRYDDGGFWPRAPDRLGYALVLEDPSDPAHPEAWRASTVRDGSPGRADPPPPYGPVVISEVLSHAEPPLVDTIELHSRAARAVDISGWLLSDDMDDIEARRGYRLPPGTVVPPNGYLVLDERDFGDGPDGFGLSAAGEAAYLASVGADGALTGYLAGVEFPASDPGVALGRVPTSVGPDLAPLAWRTFGTPNAPPRVGPVVISELMYHPAGGGMEFIELHNVSDARMPLYDPQHPSNTWSLADGVRYALPPGLALPPDGRLLVVGGLPQAFRARHGIPKEVQVFGPFDGRLDNAGERVVLAKPGQPDGDDVPAVWVDVVRYRPRAPWRAAADGGGPSLERVPADGYGNEPNHWAALTPGGTPGRANTPLVRAFVPLTMSYR